MNNITLDNIKLAVQRIAIACEQSQNRLCEADSQLGDGDLGITMQKDGDKLLMMPKIGLTI